MSLLAAAFSFLFISISCSSDDDAVDDTGIAYVQNELSYKLNGELVSISGEAAYGSFDVNTGNTMVISTTTDPELYLQLYRTPFGVGTYSNLENYELVGSYTVGADFYMMIEGEVVVSAKEGRIFKGTFNGKFKNITTDEVVELTDGEFILKYEDSTGFGRP